MQKISYMAIGCLVLMAVWLYQSNRYLSLQRDQLQMALDLSQEQLTYLQQENERINQLTQAHHLYIQQLIAESQQSKIRLAEELKDEICADKSVPDGVVERLQSHAKRIGSAIRS